jgi:hypothetical protein
MFADDGFYHEPHEKTRTFQSNAYGAWHSMKNNRKVEEVEKVLGQNLIFPLPSSYFLHIFMLFLDEEKETA